MMRVFLIFLYFYFLFSFSESKNKKVICDSPQDIILNENEIVFIESPDFPNSMTDEMIRNCTLNIIGNSTEEDSMYLNFVITNGYIYYAFLLIEGYETNDVYFYDAVPFNYYTESSALVFTYNNQSADYDNVLFQGYIFYEKYDKNSCNLVKLAQPLFLADETEIVFIYVEANKIENIRCSWNFITPKNYGFKFTVFNFISDVTVVVKNSSDYIITDIFTNSYFPYYNVDHNITVTIETSSNSPIFYALISPVKKNFTRTFGNCVVLHFTGFLTWSSSYYSNNAFCNLTTTISSNQQLFVKTNREVSDMENIADPLTIQMVNDEENIITFNPDTSSITTFGPYTNGTTKSLFWEFISDGSITTSGFVINFVLYDCECNNLTIIVPCEEEYYYYLIKTNISGDSIGLIKPNSNTTFEFSTGAALETATFEMSFQAHEKFKVLPTITLTHNIPWQALDPYLSNVMTLIPIELSDELKQNNDSLHFYPIKLESDVISLGNYFQFYSDINLTQIYPVEKINSMNLNSFVIFTSAFENKLSFIIYARKASAKNCKFQESIFFADPLSQEMKSYSMVSNALGPCEIVIFNKRDQLIIENLWTTANKNQIEIFYGLNYENKVVEFNQAHAFEWRFLYITSAFYVVKIPANSSILIKIVYELRIFISIPCLSLLETYEYGSLSSFDPLIEINTPPAYYIQNITVQFTVRDYDISKNGTLGFVDALGHKKMLTGVNQTVEFFSTTVMLIYTEPENGYKGARIYLEAFHKSFN